MSIVYQPEEVIQGKYPITGILGRGGVAITYSAVNLETNSPVAIKVISLKQLDDWKQVELFAREVEVLKQLSHPAIPDYIDYFDIETETDKAFHIVQQIAPGKSLFELVESGWRTNEREIKNIAQQILEILSYLHSLDPPVIHRDIKPNNLIRDDDGKIYLVDFGAVQNTYYDTLMQGSTVVGTYGYMSPEQFRGKALPQSDLYSLGATLLYLLTHRSPAELPQDTLKLDFRNSVDIDDSFADWLENILEPDIDDRFSSADVALVELFKSKKKKQSKLIASVSAIFLFISLIAGINSYKWFFLSRLGFNPADICSEQVAQDFLNQNGNINKLSIRNQINILARIIGTEKQADIIEHISKTKNLHLVINKGQTCKDYQDRTLLHRAILKKNPEVVKLLLDHGADANVKNGYVKPPIFNATYYGNLSIVELLIKHGADINEKDHTGKTPLFNTVSEGHINIAKLLIDSGANVHATNKKNETALFKAVNKENIILIKMLVDLGADINSKDSWQETPLHLAIRKYNTDLRVIKLLIDRGANVNAKDVYGYTPLSRAIVDLQPEIVQYLLDRGAYSYYLDYEVIKKEYYSDRINKGTIGRGYRGNDDLESIKAFLNENNFKLKNEQ